ncbi:MULTISPECIES: adenylate/guanylate cyclase domain-containing protein [Cyanophyceae]|uniref:adenylate/guanylate cyclase domain-containing protein n=1 Tax=Cyanophyceae TaxID=3028117 RepID=UPI001682B117|nr:adenylate/guanylate cyclase domain-containing protein [Nodosilinea sp. FACHB-141]MBD2113718.1 AAA family ATPase [Nodosilinea sp. FACHB-141]
MVALLGYHPQALLYESANSRVYRATAAANAQPVILKVLSPDYPTPAELARYRREYEILSSLSGAGIVRAYGLVPYEKTLVIILEDFGAIALRDVIHQESLSLEQFLELAIAITAALAQIHAANIIHKDINPANIVLNRQTGQVKIIDFGIATRINQLSPNLKHPNVLEGTLAYLSPEQTGRMNRLLDYRTDFYSLGVTCFELLTQRLPFYAADPLELIHSHLAKQPPDLTALNPAIPPLVSAIVLKLLSKNPEDRYQSALGLQADLEYCLAQWRQQGAIAMVPLGREDYVAWLSISPKLYGREDDLAALLAAFDRIATGNEATTEASGAQSQRPEMITVTGYSGIGKTTLVREIYRPITERRGYFITGKFNQLQRTIPYSALAAAFSDLVKQLLTESPEALQQWQAKLRAALGASGQVIVEVIPAVELVIGPQQPVSALGPAETKNRFQRVFQTFVRALSDPAHPLVIFLDDLQWADAGSLQLIQLMLSDRDARSLLLIGAYRSNEVSSTHPLTMALKGLAAGGVPLTQILLHPLTVDHLSQLLADSLHSDADSTRPLAELIHHKTNGNPFFANEFLKTLAAENLLHFDLDQRLWVWDIAQIQAQAITDNVVELMTEKLRKLDPKTQGMLQLAACIGSGFGLNTLAVIAQQPQAAIAADLLPALQAGLVLAPCEPDDQGVMQTYRFLHDRVQQAAYALIPESQKQRLHLQIGQLLLNDSSSRPRADGGDETLFSIVDHLNIGRSQLSTEAERLELAQLNLRAARKAKASTAYQAAHSYLAVGLDCLPSATWNQQYALTLALHQEQAEVEYLIGNFETSKQILNTILCHATAVIDQAEAYNLLVVQSTLKTDYAAALDYGRQALALLGVEFPADQYEAAFEQQYRQFQARLGDRPLSALLDQPEITEAEQRLAVKVLSNMGSAAYRYRQVIWQVVVTVSMNLFLEYGNGPESCYGYSNYGTLLGSVLGNYAAGYESCLISMQLSDRYQSLTQRSRDCFILSNFVHSWVQPLRLADGINQEGVRAGLESGEFQYVGYSLSYRISNLMAQGKPLPELTERVQEALLFCQGVNNQWAIDVLEGYQLVLANLAGQTADRLSFDLPTLTESNYLQACEAHKSYSALCRYAIAKALALYLYHADEAAWACIERALALQNYILGVISNAELHFYGALILLRLAHNATDRQRAEYQQQVATHFAKLECWATSCPDNFQHKVWLLEAELAQLQGSSLDYTLDRYDRAIAAAAAQGFLQDEAIGHECAADFWQRRHKPDFARSHRQKARYTYNRWGATGKVEQVDLPKSGNPERPWHPSGATTTGSTSGQALDLSTLMKASQAIASEIVLDQLLARLMEVLMENAGAQRGHLMLESAGSFYIEATSEVDGETTVLASLPMADRVPVSVINYVLRTQDSLVSHQTTEAALGQDPYIQRHRPQSILCTPLIHQGKLTGILYLENRLVAEVFTHDRLELLKLLSAQAAISLENARLYTTLEQKVLERTQELTAEKALSERLLLNILPESVAERLKRQNQAIADGFDAVTVLFADIVGFTRFASQIPPQQLVDLLNHIFSQFDQLCDQHGLEKIKTIGDAYMVAGGLPEPHPDHAAAIADMALAMQAAIQKPLVLSTLPQWLPPQDIAIRIGIHTGPVVAGVIGTKKFTYDLWGDTVNVASRMEAQGQGGKIQVSATTYEQLKGRYHLQRRGAIAVKGWGEMVTYWLTGPR